MKHRASSPRLVESTLADLDTALRQVMALRTLADREAGRAWQRENEAEARLHLVHDFYHELLAVEYGIKPAPWTRGQMRDPMPFILAALGDLLGYVGEAKPDRHDVQTWLDADKPTPARSRPVYDAAVQRQTSEATTRLCQRCGKVAGGFVASFDDVCRCEGRVNAAGAAIDAAERAAIAEHAGPDARGSQVHPEWKRDG